MTLSEYFKAHPEVLGENVQKFDNFPVLIKLIDAKESLSIQVHPSDEYALEHEHEYGKTEMWYIVDCDPGASLYFGVNRAVTPEELSGIFLDLIAEGAHNINLVTPTHFIPGVRRALMIKKPPVPVVYNTSGYERPESLHSLRGLVDIYLPDFKYAQTKLAGDLSNAPDYPETAIKAIHEMIRQAGPPEYDGDGMMTRGVLIRHLILPGHTKNSIEALKVIAREFPGIPVSLMAQYTPWGQAREGIPGYPELSRGITKRELLKVQEALFELGLEGFVQSRKARGAEYIPEFQ